MASIFTVTRCARQVTLASSRHVVRSFRPQWQPRLLPRSFSASAAFREKKYSEDHEWIEYSADGKTCTLGISEYAAGQLGDVVFVELPAVGLEISAGQAIGAIESVKSANDLLTPVGGKVLNINPKLEETPSLVNKDPEGAAWIAEIEVQDAGDESGLMTAERYKEFVGQEQE